MTVTATATALQWLGGDSMQWLVSELRHGRNLILPARTTAGAHAARRHFIIVLTATSVLYSKYLYYNQYTYTIINIPIPQSIYLYYNQYTYIIIKIPIL